MKKFLFSITTLFSITFSLNAQDSNSSSGKISFREAIEIGLKNNIDVKRQQNQLDFAEHQNLNSKSQYLPSLSASAQGSRTEGQQINPVTGNGQNFTSDRLFASVDANYTLFNGLSRYYNARASNTNVKSQIHGVERTKQDVISSITSQYLQVLLDAELLQITKENLETQKLLLEQIQEFVNVGSRAKPDEYAQLAIVKNAELNLIRAEGTYKNDKSILSQTLQLDELSDIEVEVPEWSVDDLLNFNYSMEELFDIAMQNRDDLQQSEFNTRSSQLLMKSNNSGYLPNIGVFASYGSQYFAVKGNDNAESFSTQFYDLNPYLTYGFRLTIPIFDRFQTYSNKSQARVNYLNAQNNYNNLKKTVKIDVQRSFQNYENAIASYKASLTQLESTKLSYDLEKERFDLGISGLVDYDQANQRYVQAKGDIAQATYTLLFQDILLQYAVGTLSVEDIPSN